jgi:Na+:H+ antiporter, NhaA family
MAMESDGPRGPFARFLQHEAASSVLLLAATVTALVWANSPWSDGYGHLLHIDVGLSWGDARFTLSLQHWVNDGLMAVFFFVVGLEIKREIALGQLSTLRSATLPVAGALGGMILPALIYATINARGPGARGWGIPMATDIAFALGILALVGKRAPLGLKVFLTALAIADDLAAVLVIAIFYTEQIVIGPLIVALSLLALLFVAGRLGVRQIWIYALLVVGVWLATFASGIHATVAGILVALVVPIKSRIDPEKFLSRAVGALNELQQSKLTRASLARDHQQFAVVQDLHEVSSDLMPAGIFFEKALHPITAFLILPLFAFFNAGVVLDTGLRDALVHPVSLGILAGLVIGKPVGIGLACFIVMQLGFADLPRGVSGPQLVGASILAGIGFTMSLFISDLALSDPALIAPAKAAILVAAILAASTGFAVLRFWPRSTA